MFWIVLIFIVVALIAASLNSILAIFFELVVALGLITTQVNMRFNCGETIDSDEDDNDGTIEG